MAHQPPSVHSFNAISSRSFIGLGKPRFSSSPRRASNSGIVTRGQQGLAARHLDGNAGCTWIFSSKVASSVSVCKRSARAAYRPPSGETLAIILACSAPHAQAGRDPKRRARCFVFLQPNEEYAVAVEASGYRRPFTIGTRSAKAQTGLATDLETASRIGQPPRSIAFTSIATPSVASSSARKVNSHASTNGGFVVSMVAWTVADHSRNPAESARSHMRTRQRRAPDPANSAMIAAI